MCSSSKAPTDNSKIAKIAKESGATIIKRPRNLATDTATTESTIEHYLHSVQMV